MTVDLDDLRADISSILREERTDLSDKIVKRMVRADPPSQGMQGFIQAIFAGAT